jgi:hypothetical protein
MNLRLCVWGRGGGAPYIFNICTRRKWVFCFTLRKIFPQEKSPVPIGKQAEGAPELSGHMKTKWKSTAAAGNLNQPSTDVLCNFVLSGTVVEDAMLVGAMVTYFCQESVPPMTARQGLVAAALLRERECFHHLVPPLTVPAKLLTALTPAKSKNFRENYWNTSVPKYDRDGSYCSSF